MRLTLNDRLRAPNSTEPRTAAGRYGTFAVAILVAKIAKIAASAQRSLKSTQLQSPTGSIPTNPTAKQILQASDRGLKVCDGNDRHRY